MIGRGNSGNLSVLDIIILQHALLGDNTFNMGAVVAKRLARNRTKGPIFGGIYAARLARHFQIPIRHHEEKETILPPHILDYKSMIAHKFIVDNEDRMLLYKLRFNKKHFEIIILAAPLLFDLLAEKFLVTPEAVNNHLAQAFTPEPEPEPEPELDPYRASSVRWDPEMTSQYYPDYTSHYTGESSGGPWY